MHLSRKGKTKNHEPMGEPSQVWPRSLHKKQPQEGLSSVDLCGTEPWTDASVPIPRPLVMCTLGETHLGGILQ